MTSYKSDMETRVGYASTKSRFQVQRVQKAHQQIVPQQQNQEEIVEIDLPGPCRWRIPKNFFEVNLKPEEEVSPKPSKKGFNVYVSCLDLEADEHDPIVASPNDPEGGAAILDYFKDDVTIFEGVFGNAIINKNGLVLYTDFSGKKHCEEIDQNKVEKIFPMGIARGGLTKSIWFEDAVTRDDCFDLIKSMPPSYNTVMANPPKFRLTTDTDDDNMKVFEGINDTNVIVHADNIVLYTDLDRSKHCVQYNKHKIHKCFPNGIYGGGLPRTIWFNDENERELCFMLMKWNMDEPVPAEIDVVHPLSQDYTGLCGDIVLHSDCQIEFTSLNGVPMKCSYEPTKIQEVFPNGISNGRLPKSIWFQNVEERDNCIAAMRGI